VARFGNRAKSTQTLDAAVGALRWHHGAPAEHHSGPLSVEVLADPEHGPFVAASGRNFLLVHGTGIASLPELADGDQRFAALECDGTVLRASRDALGEVPLFFRLVDGAAWLSTEIYPLVGLAPAGPELEAVSADAGFVPYPNATGWEGIFRVPPGATVVIDASMRVTFSSYWRPERLLATRRSSYDDAVAEFRQLFDAAVARRRTPTAGVLLSGGLDSAAVAVAAPGVGAPPKLLTVAFPEFPETDETPFARATADAVGVPLKVVSGPTDPWNAEAEPAIFGALSQLVPTGIFETAAREFLADGVDVILDGHDGDGALGLYSDIYGQMLAHFQLRRLAALARRYGRRDTLSRAARELMLPWIPRLGGPQEASALANELLPYFTGRTAARMGKDVRRRGLRRSWRRLQLMPLRPPITLVFEQMETESARCGVDLRHPFGDRALLRFLVSLPFSVKVDPERSKPLLRDGLREVLPDAVRLRSGKVWFNPVLDRRVDPQTCFELVKRADVLLPDFDYDRFLRTADADPRSISTFAWIRLVRAHLFASAAASPPKL
jgi:asparagine synthase (glutamine-hydrolysing)